MQPMMKYVTILLQLIVYAIYTKQRRERDCKMKKLIPILLSVSMVFGLAACSGGAKPAPEATPAAEAAEENAGEAAEGEEAAPRPETGLRIGMITDVGGVNDQSFNQSAWEGMLMAKEELGVEVSYTESKTDADYAPNIETMIDAGNDLILGVGFKMGDAIKEAAANYPDQQFAIIDYTYDPALPNVTGILFKANEASFLVGLIAAKMSETGNVGFVNGMDSPTMNEFGYGYYAGVLTANPDAKVFGQYADSFTDPAKGKAIANQMYADGCDIVYAAAGDTGNGVIEAAKEKGKWAIGVDRDQNYLAPDNVMSSAMKRVDMAVYDMAKKLVDGNLTGGETVVYGLESQGVDIAPTSAQHVSQEVLDYVNEMKAKIIAGEIKVPINADEFAAQFAGAAFMQ